MKATVLYGINNLFTLELPGGARMAAGIKGKVLKESKGDYNALAPGDIVEVESDIHDSGRGRILSLEPRRNSYGRWNEKGRSSQVLAANVDRTILVVSPSMPPFRPRFIDRVQTACAVSGIPLVLVMNKIDREIGPEVRERLDDYRRIGLTILLCSAKTGEGIGELKELASRGLSVFTGQSGTGKSSILNALEEGLGLKVGQLCAKWDRGSHTTIVSAMFRLTGVAGAVIDTPGFRRFALRGIDVDALASYFPEMAGLDADCEFGPSCAHVEEGACALLKAVNAGRIHPDRFESYLRIRDELDCSFEYEKKASVLANPHRRMKRKDDEDDWPEAE
jgi:ribosome biogenesis GTPase / thiamine phosphate phosphatase